MQVQFHPLTFFQRVVTIVNRPLLHSANNALWPNGGRNDHMEKGLRMHSLELKVPPPLVALVTALAMWGLARSFPSPAFSTLLRIPLAIAIALIGGGFSLAGVRSFRRAKTTVNPMKPENASSLVSSGIYKVTRNPMYVGLLCVLVAWGVYLASVWTAIGPVFFVLYMNQFQIKPEERVLAAMFGESYAVYKSKVRRWL